MRAYRSSEVAVYVLERSIVVEILAAGLEGAPLPCSQLYVIDAADVAGVRVEGGEVVVELRGGASVRLAVDRPLELARDVERLARAFYSGPRHLDH